MDESRSSFAAIPHPIGAYRWKESHSFTRLSWLESAKGHMITELIRVLGTCGKGAAIWVGVILHLPSLQISGVITCVFLLKLFVSSVLPASILGTELSIMEEKCLCHVSYRHKSVCGDENTKLVVRQ